MHVGLKGRFNPCNRNSLRNFAGFTVRPAELIPPMRDSKAFPNASEA
jgi:hypothetical protein